MAKTKKSEKQEAQTSTSTANATRISMLQMVPQEQRAPMLAKLMADLDISEEEKLELMQWATTSTANEQPPNVVKLVQPKPEQPAASQQEDNPFFLPLDTSKGAKKWFPPIQLVRLSEGLGDDEMLEEKALLKYRGTKTWWKRHVGEGLIEGPMAAIVQLTVSNNQLAAQHTAPASQQGKRYEFPQQKPTAPKKQTAPRSQPKSKKPAYEQELTHDLSSQLGALLQQQQTEEAQQPEPTTTSETPVVEETIEVVTEPAVAETAPEQTTARVEPIIAEPEAENTPAAPESNDEQPEEMTEEPELQEPAPKPITRKQKAPRKKDPNRLSLPTKKAANGGFMPSVKRMRLALKLTDTELLDVEVAKRYDATANWWRGKDVECFHTKHVLEQLEQDNAQRQGLIDAQNVNERGSGFVPSFKIIRQERNMHPWLDVSEEQLREFEGSAAWVMENFDDRPHPINSALNLLEQMNADNRAYWDAPCVPDYITIKEREGLKFEDDLTEDVVRKHVQPRWELTKQGEKVFELEHALANLADFNNRKGSGNGENTPNDEPNIYPGMPYDAKMNELVRVGQMTRAEAEAAIAKHEEKKEQKKRRSQKNKTERAEANRSRARGGSGPKGGNSNNSGGKKKGR